MSPRKAVYRCGAQRKTANLAKGFLLGHASSASTECMAPRKAVYRCGTQRKTANLAKRFPNYPYDTPILSSGSVLQAKRGGSLFSGVWVHHHISRVSVHAVFIFAVKIISPVGSSTTLSSLYRHYHFPNWSPFGAEFCPFSDVTASFLFVDLVLLVVLPGK